MIVVAGVLRVLADRATLPAHKWPRSAQTLGAVAPGLEQTSPGAFGTYPTRRIVAFSDPLHNNNGKEAP